MLVFIPTIEEARILFGEQDAEAILRKPLHTIVLEGIPFQAALCGFGLAGSGASSSYLLTQYVETERNESRLPRVWLMGIGGSFDRSEAPIGSSVFASRIVCRGITLDEAESRAPSFPQAYLPNDDPIQDEIHLSNVPPYEGARMGCAISVTSPSSTPQQADERRRSTSDALVEEMEGFSVALACKLHGVTFTMVRGISNLAGDRDMSGWKIAEALEAARNSFIKTLL